MEIKSYPVEKRRILAELAKQKGSESLICFDEGIGTKRKRNLSKILPPLKKGGFRKLEMRLKEQARLFVQRLTREKEIEESASSDWNTFEKIWVSWVQSKPELNNILLEFDNGADFDENHRCIVLPNSELDRECFKILQDASHNHQINQETIRRFYQYGYFLEDKQIEDLIDSALTQEEIEHKQRLEKLPDKFAELSQTIEDLESRISAVESANELKQQLDKQITEASEAFEENFQKLNQQITAVSESLNTKISKINSSSIKMSELSKQINILKSQLSALKKSVNTIENKLQTTDAPRIAYQAVEIGKNAASLVKNKKKQKNEEDYLQEFRIPLWLLGITESIDSSEAKAIHVALKTFSVIEITDARIIDAWKAACGNNLHITILDVGMGWLDTQDWFPSYFSMKCFGEEMRLMDLDTSVAEMFNSGNQLWAIDIRNCDRSYPESYLPDFLRWIDKHRSYAKVFLTRCLGENCCNTSFEVYNEVGKLPKPTKMQSIEPVTLPVSEAIVDKSGWEHWCQPADEKLHQTEIQLLDKLQLEIENLPLSLLQDIKSYLLLSHQIFDPDKALDWALYLRLYQWIADRKEDDRNELENSLLNLINQSDLELPKTKAALQSNL